MISKPSAPIYSPDDIFKLICVGLCSGGGWFVFLDGGGGGGESVQYCWFGARRKRQPFLPSNGCLKGILFLACTVSGRLCVRPLWLLLMLWTKGIKIFSKGIIGRAFLKAYGCGVFFLGWNGRNSRQPFYSRFLFALKAVRRKGAVHHLFSLPHWRVVSAFLVCPVYISRSSILFVA